MSFTSPEKAGAGAGMRALILVGGYGTRLRPLTLTKPKPLVPFCNKPMIIHQVEALKEAGVTEVVLAVAYRPDEMKEEMKQWGDELGITFVYSLEEEPLGTAGPLALARDVLMKDDQPFFVLNSDVTCKFPLRELLAFHRNHGKEGTIMVTKVVDPSKYGVVVYDEADGCIDQFVEKPKKFCGDKINAGIYVFNKSILERIKPVKTSIETQVFPAMASQRQLHCMELEGFWMDIGQPHDYLDGLGKFLPALAGSAHDSLVKHGDNGTVELGEGKSFTVKGCVMIHPTAKVGEHCVFGPNVTIGKNCVIGTGVRLQNCAVLDGTVIGDSTYISMSIIGWNNRIDKWCRIENYTVLGDDVLVRPELYLNGVKVLPNKSISISYPEPAVVM